MTTPFVITAAEVDVDFFAFDLAAGDVIGATVSGGATELTVYRLDGTQMVGAEGTDVASALYPPESPLPGGGNTTFAYVAEEPGDYAVQIDGAAGRYDAKVEAYRPGSETDQAESVQTVFLDFDGARVNTGDLGRARGTGALALLGVHRQVGPRPCPGGRAGRPESPRRSRRTSGPT